MNQQTPQELSTLDRFIVGYANWIITLRWLVVPLMLGLVVLVISGLRFAGFTSDYRYFFDDFNPRLAAFDQLERTYSSPDTLLWVMQSSEVEATHPRMLKVVYDLTEAAWQTPYSTRVDSITNFQNTTADGDDLLVRALVEDPEAITPEGAVQIKQTVLDEPLLAQRLLSLDGRTTAVVATLTIDRTDTAASGKAMAFARELADEVRAHHPDITVAITGSAVLSNTFSEVSQSDITTLFPIMIVLLAVAMYLLLRSVSGTLAAMIVVISSALMAMAMSGWLGVKITPPSSSTPTIVLTVAVADSVHILVTMLVEMFRGRSKYAAIVESLRVNWGPVFLTSITTAIGFASLNFADAPPMHDLGNFSAAGAIFAWILSITLLPALLAILPIESRASIQGQAKVMEALANFVIHYRYAMLFIMTGLIIALTSLLPTLYFNDKFVEYFDERVEFRTHTDWAAENLVGIYVLHYSLGAGEPGGVANPDYLDKVEEFAQWFRIQPNVVHVASFTDVLKRVNRSMHGDDHAYYKTPVSREEAAQYLLLYEMSLPYGLDLNDQVNVDKSATKLSATLTNVSTTEMEQLTADAKAWLQENAPASMYTEPAGQANMFAYIGRSNFDTMRLGTAVAFILISAILMVFLRSIKLGLISLVPNMLPPLVAFGIFALFDKELGLWSAFIAATAMGLIVDATVHFLSKYQRARIDQGASAEDAIRYAFSTVGTALWVSTSVLIAGFGVLFFSTFKINSLLGLMVANTVAVALVIDFLLLPVLLLMLDRGPGKGRIQTAKSVNA